MPDTDNLVKQFEKPTNSVVKEIVLPVAIILLIIIAGGITGYFINNRQSSTNLGSASGSTQATRIQTAKEVGVKDDKAFPDQATGKIVINDNKNVSDGSHQLVRPGGADQTAYLTSSIVDLKEFEGKCVQLWGQTLNSKKAGWFLDVGRLKILDQCPEGL